MGREAKMEQVGFGVGALEEQDEDIYENDAIDDYDRFVLTCCSQARTHLLL